jgi:hypothetical protein
VEELAGILSDLHVQEFRSPNICKYFQFETLGRVDLIRYLSGVTENLRHPVGTVTDLCCIDYEPCEANQQSIPRWRVIDYPVSIAGFYRTARDVIRNLRLHAHCPSPPIPSSLLPAYPCGVDSTS